MIGNPPIHVESGYVYKGTNRPVMAINSIFGEEYLKECCCKKIYYLFNRIF